MDLGQLLERGTSQRRCGSPALHPTRLPCAFEVVDIDASLSFLGKLMKPNEDFKVTSVYNELVRIQATGDTCD